MSHLKDNRQSNTTKDDYSLTEQDLWEQKCALSLFGFTVTVIARLTTYKTLQYTLKAGKD